MSESINNLIPYVPENVIDVAAGVNLAINSLDALVQCDVKTMGDNIPPVGIDGDRHIVGEVPTGVWSGMQNKLAYYSNNQWKFFDVYIVTFNGIIQVFNGTTWVALSGGGSVSSVDINVPSGMTSTGGPITTAGTINLDFDTGYGLITDSERSDLASALQPTGDTIQDITIERYVESIGIATTENISIDNGLQQVLNISGNTVLTFSDLTSGRNITLIFTGDFSFSVTYPAGLWRGGTPVDLTGLNNPRVLVENVSGVIYYTYLGDWS